MRVKDILRAWGTVLGGRVPSLSIEITRECPLSCPGCYAYNDEHLNNGLTLRELPDKRGRELVEGVLEVVRRKKPLHLSIVGGDPLVRLFELEELLPQLTAMGVHCQVVTSAFRKIPAHWKDNPHVNVVVSIDGLQPEHDERRKPATYERILRNIADARIEVHCTITRQMMGRHGYLEEFTRFWSERPEVSKILMSIYTPQRGEISSERLTRADRERVIAELTDLDTRYPKLAMGPRLVEAFRTPPQTPEECMFARTTETISADLVTKITPCQFGGDPNCAECGCVASVGLHAVSNRMLGGVLRVGAIYDASERIGTVMATSRR